MCKKVEDILSLGLAVFIYKLVGIKDFFYLWSYYSCRPWFQTRNDRCCLASKEKPALNPIYSINAVFLLLRNLFNLTSYNQLVADRLQFIIVEGDRHFISISTN